MMGGVSPETCWASYKYEIKFWCTVVSCWIFFVNYTMMHGSKNIKFRKLGFWKHFNAKVGYKTSFSYKGRSVVTTETFNNVCIFEEWENTYNSKLIIQKYLATLSFTSVQIYKLQLKYLIRVPDTDKPQH